MSFMSMVQTPESMISRMITQRFSKSLAFLLAFGLVIAVSAAPQQNPPAGPPAPPQQLTVWAPHTVAPEKIDADMNAKIRTEGMEHSKIMWIEHYLTDVYGPRPIGSPNHDAAANWAVKTMTSWGMKNAHLEPFTWRGIGWLPGPRDAASSRRRSKANLKFEAMPWSPSTNGTVSGEVVQHRRAGESDRGGADRVSRRTSRRR